jgi:hypothetical protein
MRVGWVRGGGVRKETGPHSLSTTRVRQNARKRRNPGNNLSGLMSSFGDEILRRRTFAIISHPDAGKTALRSWHRGKIAIFGHYDVV